MAVEQEGAPQTTAKPRLEKSFTGRNSGATRGAHPVGTHSDSHEYRTGKRSSKVAWEFSKGEHFSRAGQTRHRSSHRARDRLGSSARSCSHHGCSPSRSRHYKSFGVSGNTGAQETSELVVIGIKPTWACPGFGYIEHGKPVRLRKRPDNEAIHRVERFREKPNPDLAESFLRRGNFRWNAGMFVWSVPTVLREFNRYAPELADFISQLRAPGNFETTLHERFSKLPRISFDYAIMEKADRVLVVEAGFDWDDIGSWHAVANYFEKDKRGNAANRAITAVDSSNNIVFDEEGTTIALLGVHDLIVVRTPDALLVCHRHEAERIKDLIGKLPPELQ